MVLRLLFALLSITGTAHSACVDGVCSDVLLQLDFQRLAIHQRGSKANSSQNFAVDRLVQKKGFARAVHASGALSFLEEKEPQKIFFFTHHKSGTVLARDLAKMLASALGTKHTRYAWPELEKKTTGSIPGCAPTHVSTYQNMNKDVMEKIMKECTDFKAVHFIREAAAITVSAYLYHSDIQNSWDSIPGANDSYDTLSQLDTKQGLLQEAKAQVDFTLKDMAEVHEILDGTSSALTVGLEEFDADYDSVTRKIFSFLLGSNHSQVDNLVEMATEYDTSRWTDSDVATSSHVSDKDKTSDTLEMFLENQQQESIVEKVIGFDERLGYTAPTAA